jgi:hypothetical protein
LLFVYTYIISVHSFALRARLPTPNIKPISRASESELGFAAQGNLMLPSLSLLVEFPVLVSVYKGNTSFSLKNRMSHT